jgi:hypothetical protein
MKSRSLFLSNKSDLIRHWPMPALRGLAGISWRPGLSKKWKMEAE